MADVIVIGGGIIGTAVAYHAAAADLETLLFDRQDTGAATAAGAGIVSPETSRHASAVWYDLAVRAAAYYPELDARLRAAGVSETGYARPGTLVVDPAGYDPDPYDRGQERVFDRQDRYDHPSTDVLRRVDGARAAERFPPLSATRRGIHYDDGGRVDGATFRDAMLEAANDATLATVRATVETIDVQDGRVTGVQVDGRRYEADAVVVAGGAWSPSFADDLGIAIPVSPERGQILRLVPDRPVDGWPIVNTFQGYYLVPWPDGTVSVGATREADAGYDPRVTAGGVHELTDALLTIADGLASATLDRVTVGLRPASDDGRPFIGPVPTVEGAFLATGHGSTGLQLGPYTGTLVAALLAGEEPDTAIDPFSPARILDG